MESAGRRIHRSNKHRMDSRSCSRKRSCPLNRRFLDTKMKRFNEWLAEKLGNSLSSMTFFYFCVLIDLIELKPVIDANNVITWCTYISQTVIQLVALPILGAQQKITHGHHEKHHKNLADIHTKLDRLLASKRRLKD